MPSLADMLQSLMSSQQGVGVRGLMTPVGDIIPFRRKGIDPNLGTEGARPYYGGASEVTAQTSFSLPKHAEAWVNNGQYPKITDPKEQEALLRIQYDNDLSDQDMIDLLAMSRDWFPK